MWEVLQFIVIIIIIIIIVIDIDIEIQEGAVMCYLIIKIFLYAYRRFNHHYY